MKWLFTLVILTGCAVEGSEKQPVNWEEKKALAAKQSHQLRDYLVKVGYEDGLTTHPGNLKKLEAPTTVGFTVD